MGKSHCGHDIESGNGLYPNMTEDPKMRWAFIRKVYVILTFQILLTTIVTGVFTFVPAIKRFFHTPAGLGVMIAIMVLSFIVLIAMCFLKDMHPINMILLLLFTLCMSAMVGLACLTKSGKVVMEASVVTLVVFVGLTLYTFWAAKRGHDFNFLGPFLFSALLILVIFSLVQIFFPMGKLVHTIIAGISALLFCGFIIYDTDNIIKRFDYDDYLIAALDLYLDIINLFVNLLTLFSALDS
ncbi:hypothetical protein LUZ60_010223 [Juncus effusus]|nr:hypothetical protein LUZ60_010223 [Juncus effusus]